MDSSPPLDLPLALTALQQRAGKELRRLEGIAVPGTESVGGWAQVGKCLDALLRVTFILHCYGLGRSPDAEFRRLSDKEGWTIARAMAGQLAHVLPLLAHEAPPQGELPRAIIDAARDPTSALRRAIAARNTMVHDDAPRPIAELRSLLAELVAWSAALAAKV